MAINFRRIQVAISYRICFEGVDTRHTGLYCQPVTNMAVNYNIYWRCKVNKPKLNPSLASN
jgi:hypothetical protein